jgi:hypothetical protein
VAVSYSNCAVVRNIVSRLGKILSVTCRKFIIPTAPAICAAQMMGAFAAAQGGIYGHQEAERIGKDMPWQTIATPRF